MPIALREDFDARSMRAGAKRAKDAAQARQLLALAAIDDGASREKTAEIGGVTRQIVRDWVVKFNADGPDGLINRKAPGQPSRLDSAHRAALAAMVESGPIPAAHGVARWRLVDLCQWMFEEFQVTIAKQTMNRELRALGYRKLSARPKHHAQAEGAIENLKKLPRAPGGGRAGKGVAATGGIHTRDARAELPARQSVQNLDQQVDVFARIVEGQRGPHRCLQAEAAQNRLGAMVARRAPRSPRRRAPCRPPACPCRRARRTARWLFRFAVPIMRRPGTASIFAVAYSSSPCS